MQIIGLTGGIASGKSSVSRILTQSGIPLLDCDEIAKEVVKPGRWGHRRIVHAFGPSVLAADGGIDRERLGKLVFGNDAARKKLNKATHLPVFTTLLWRIFLSWLQLKPLVVVDMPLLFETSFHRYCSSAIVVYCSKDQQIGRMMKRDGPARTLEDARARVEAQMSLDIKRERASIVILNDGSAEELRPQVEALLKNRLQPNRGSMLKHIILSPISIGLGVIVGVAKLRGLV